MRQTAILTIFKSHEFTGLSSAGVVARRVHERMRGRDLLLTFVKCFILNLMRFVVMKYKL